jgi:hypothetical protein
MVETVINTYVAQHPDVTIDALKQVFPDHLNPLRVIKSFAEGVKDPKRYYVSQLPSGEQFYIAAGWGPNINKFIEVVHSTISGIVITNVE